MNRSESKYFSTAKRRDDAFLELISKKDFAYITVKEICDKAKVNRSTFYLHYETLDDLLNECSTQRVSEFIRYRKGSPKDFIGKIKDCPIEELYLITDDYLVPYLTFVKEHRRIFKVFREKSTILNRDDAYKDREKHIFSPILDRFHIPENDKPYRLRFYITGIRSVVSEWMSNDCKDPIEHVIGILHTCVPKVPSPL